MQKLAITSIVINLPLVNVQYPLHHYSSKHISSSGINLNEVANKILKFVQFNGTSSNLVVFFGPVGPFLSTKLFYLNQSDIRSLAMIIS